MIPVAIRRWFLAHFALNLLIGGPLLLIPRSFLEGMGWITVDPASARFCGAALIAVGVQSLLTYNEGHHAVRTMLNFNMVWSWAAIAGLVFAAAEGAPNPVWALLAVFIAMSGVWFHLRVQLGEYMDLGAPISGELPIFPLSPQLQAAANAHDAQEVSHQFFVDESAVQESAPRKVVPPKPRGPDLIGDQPIDDRSANSLLGLVGQPSTPDAEGQAPDSDSLDPDAIAAMMAEAQTTGTAHAVSTEAAAAEASAEAAPAAPAPEEVAPAAQEASEPPAAEVVATPEEATGDAVGGETTAAPSEATEDVISPAATEDVPEAVVAEAAQPDPALFDDALAAVDALAPVEQADPSPSALVADEITNETSVDQIEEASALEAAPAPVAAADEAPVPTETPADEISRAIDSELNPAAAKLPPPLPPPGKTLHGLPVLRLAEEAAPANLEPEKLEVPAVPEDEELGGDAIAAMLAANRG